MKIFLGLLLVALASRQFAHSAPADSNDDDDYLGDKSDDNYDENDFEESDDAKKSSTASSTTTEEPYNTQDYIETAETGRTIVLKCLGENIDSSSLFMWHNGSMLLAQGESKTPQAPHRVSFSKKDGLLTIRDVSSYDDGTFRCRAYGNKNGRYETLVHVQVNGPPRGITIGHNINNRVNIADETLVYSAGKQSLSFRCNVAKARPDAKIDWIHNGNTILELQQEDHDLKIEDEGVLVIKTLHARHAGEYQCEASNEFGNLKASFKIDVQYPPFFDHHRSYFNAEEGSDVELHCLYKSFPASKSVKWFKGGSKIHDNDKYKIDNDMKEHHDRTKLLIRNVNKNDLTTYQCEVENELGVKRENISVGVGPAPPKYVGFKYINNKVFTDWVIKSHQPLTELQILYRNHELGWKPKNAKITNRNEIRAGEWKVQGSIELDAGDWTIMARSKNTEGWSDDRFSQETRIQIPKDSIESQNQTSSASSVSQTVIGLLALLLLQRFA